jgi:hypothetical protein
MVKRLVLVTLLAAGGTGMYVFGSGALAPAPAPESGGEDLAASADESEGEWKVEYVDNEGNPIQRETGLLGATNRFKLASKPFLKRASGAAPVRSGKGEPAAPPGKGLSKRSG